MFGRGYVIDHCIAEYEHTMEERRYRAYVTDVLSLVNENLTKQYGGKTMSSRWVDAYLPVDNRTGDEIAMDVMRRAGLKQGDNTGEP